MKTAPDFPVSLPGSSAPLMRAVIGRWVLAVLALLLAGVRAAGQGEPPPLPPGIAEIARKFAGVTEWQGFFEVSETGSSSASNPFTGYNAFAQGESRSHGRFTLKRSTVGWDPRRGMFSWVVADGAPGEATGVAHEQLSEKASDGAAQEWRRELTATVPMLSTEFAINLTKQSVTLHPGGTPPEKQPNWTRTGQRTSQVSSGDGQRRFTTTSINETFPGAVTVWYLGVRKEDLSRKWAVVRGGPGVLKFTHELPGNLGLSFSSSNSPHSFVSTKRSSVLLFPVYDDLEVEVTIDGYAKWRPEGSIKDLKKPGNSLVARATLKSKTGKLKDLPAVRRFKFELLDTSREPGVCLNWPLAAKDTDFDLRLASEGTGDLSAAEQKLEVAGPRPDDKGQPYAEARIDSYDFGGRATLQVLCELEDGREIMGLMKGEGGGQDLVRLPKRDGPDWIAEAWRKEKKSEKLAANDDNEKVEGQQHNGDGFTLYEEYRGWVENGKHIEGDPEKKDFFVLNMIGADAKGGLGLFERLSKLRVHSKLRDEREISQAARLMNGNRRDGPYRVDQHGVVISNVGLGVGGATIGIEGADGGKAARPRLVNWVFVESRSSTSGVLGAKASAEYNLSERDAQSAYDRAVAHELLHAVGVDHHGEVTWQLVRCNFQGASAPLNPTHRARFTVGLSYHTFQIDTPKDWSGDRGDTITLLWEDTQRDVVEDSLAAYEAELAIRRAAHRTENYVKEYAATAARLSAMGIAKDAAFWAESDADRLASMDHIRGIRVGAQGGTDCGNELCVMRYYFADAYKIAGRKNAYYLIRPGSNRAGREICHTPAGTGTNAASHQPQSRYGDAASGRGNCFGDICPNDAIPPRSIVLK